MTSLAGGFTLFCGLLVGIVLWRVSRILPPRQNAVFAAGLGAWLLVSGAAARSGFLLDANAMPPRMMLLLIAVMVWLGWMAIGRYPGELARVIDQKFLIGFCVFRVGVELTIFSLYVWG